MAIDSSGNIYVADTSRDRIQKFTSSGNFISQIGSYGTANGQFNDPWDVAVDLSGNIYVVEYYNNRIQKLDNNGNHIWTVGGTAAGTANGQFLHPSSIALDSSGNVYVTDRGNNRIQKFDNNGNHLLTFGSFGTGAGQFINPTGITIDSSDILYIITGNYKIEKYSSSGVYLGQLFQYYGNSLLDLYVDSGNNFFVSTKMFNYVIGIIKLNSSGTQILSIGATSGGSGIGEFYTPGGAVVDSSGNLYVADSTNNRIQKFKYYP